MRLILIALGLAAFVGSAAAQTTSGTAGQQPNVADIVFSELEKRLLRDYFGQGKSATDSADKKKKGESKSTKAKGKGKGKGGRGGGLPPGLAKKDSLPPGLARQLERNGTLPPGLATRDLPTDLKAKLPPTGASRERVIVENDVVLIERATGRILDILKDVIK